MRAFRVVVFLVFYAGASASSSRSEGTRGTEAGEGSDAFALELGAHAGKRLDAALYRATRLPWRVLQDALRTRNPRSPRWLDGMEGRGNGSSKAT